MTINKVKKAGFFLIIIAVSATLLALKIEDFMMKKQLMNNNLSIIWAQGEALDANDKWKMTTRLYRWELGKTEELLEDRYYFHDFVCSKDHKKLLSLVDYKYVAEYDLETKELSYLIHTEQLDAFLKEKGYRGRLIDDAWLHCPRYYDDENKISVMYGNFIIGYSSQEGYELLYVSKNIKDIYSWAYDDSALLICQHDGRLRYYDRNTRQSKTLVNPIYTFSSVTENNQVVLKESKGYACLYDLENQKYKKLFKGGYGSPQYEISDDGQYLLWNDKVRVSMQEMNFLYLVDLESGKKMRLKKWGFDVSVYGVAWN